MLKSPFKNGGYLTVALIGLIATYGMWAAGVAQDFLFSAPTYFPYPESVAMVAFAAAAFVALLGVRSARSWVNAVLWISILLPLADLLHLAPDVGIFPSVAMLACGFGVASLLSRKESRDETFHRVYAGASLTAGVADLLYRSGQMHQQKLAVLSLGAAAGLAASAVRLARGRQRETATAKWNDLARGWSALVLAGFLLLVWKMLIPRRVPPLSSGWTVGIGLGSVATSTPGGKHLLKFFLISITLAIFGLLAAFVSNNLKGRISGRISGYRFLVGICSIAIPIVVLAFFLPPRQRPLLPFRDVSPIGTVIAAEYGLFTLGLFTLMLSLSMVTGVVVINRLRQNRQEAEASGEHTLALCAGAMGSLLGMLLCSTFVHPFLSFDSVVSTGAVAVAIASVGMSCRAAIAQQTPAVAEPQQGRDVVEPQGRFARSRMMWLPAALLVCAFLLGIREHHRWRNMIAVYSGTAAPAGFVGTYARLGDIPISVQYAILAAEDGRFYEHYGLDWRAIHNALRLDLREGNIISGASTLEQQLAKNLFLSNERTVKRKLAEAALALEIEELLPKQRILELYLNYVDYGAAARGISAAASYYFGKAPSELSVSEGALLAGLLRHSRMRSNPHQLAIDRSVVFERLRSIFGAQSQSWDLDRAENIRVSGLLRRDVMLAQKPEEGQEIHPVIYKDQRFWWCISLLILLGALVGLVLPARLALLALRSSVFAGGPSGRLLLGLALSAGLWIVFSGTAWRWYENNRQRLFYTVVYPYRYSMRYSSRRPGAQVNCIVLHAVLDDAIEHAVASFQSATTQSSTHFLIANDGRIIQMLPLEVGASHAGTTALDGVPDVDNFSIGIDFLTAASLPAREAYSQLQYESGARIISQLREHFSIADDHIVSQARVGLTQGEELDPVGLDFSKLQRLLNTLKSETSTGAIAPAADASR